MAVLTDRQVVELISRLLAGCKAGADTPDLQQQGMDVAACHHIVHQQCCLCPGGTAIAQHPHVQHPQAPYACAGARGKGVLSAFSTLMYCGLCTAQPLIEGLHVEVVVRKEAEYAGVCVCVHNAHRHSALAACMSIHVHGPSNLQSDCSQVNALLCLGLRSGQTISVVLHLGYLAQPHLTGIRSDQSSSSWATCPDVAFHASMGHCPALSISFTHSAMSQLDYPGVTSHICTLVS